MPLSQDELRRRCEALYYGPGDLPRDAAALADFLRSAGVYPSTSVIDTQLKKLKSQRRGASGVASVYSFADVMAVATACLLDAAKLDPSVAEDQDYFQEAWTVCGGDPEMQGVVPASVVAAMLSSVGLSDDAVTNRKVAPVGAGRSMRGMPPGACDGDALAYKDFVEIVAAERNAGGAQEQQDAEATDMFGEEAEDTNGNRPRLSLVIMMRLKGMLRRFRIKREARLAAERKERELAEYEAKYFGTNLLTSPLAAADDPQQQAPPQHEKQQQLAASTAATAPKPAAAAGGGASAVRARKRGTGLPPLVDDRESAFDKALARHEQERRRKAREQHRQRLAHLNKAQPRRDGCVDVVSRYATQPVSSPMKERVLLRSTTPAVGVMGRPKPAPLSPTQLRQSNRTPQPRR